MRSDSKQVRDKFQLVADRLRENYLADPRMESVVAALAVAAHGRREELAAAVHRERSESPGPWHCLLQPGHGPDGFHSR